MRCSSSHPQWVFLLIALATISHLSTAEEPQPIPPQPHSPDLLLDKVLQWRDQLRGSQERELTLDLHTVTAVILCFASASISSAGGVGGGALFLPILNLVAGLNLKAATTFSAFMVTGGAISNVLYNMFFKSSSFGGRSLIDYDIALLSEPCMLLGVTVGVVCNVVFPEWLVTMLFVMLLAWSTFKTCRAGVVCWKGESEAARRGKFCKLEGGEGREERVAVKDGDKGIREPLLGGLTGGKKGTPWKKMLVLLLTWVSFFLLQFIRGDKEGKGVVRIERCGVGYWLITSSQVPLALLFTAYFLYGKSRARQHHISQEERLEVFLLQTSPSTSSLFIAFFLSHCSLGSSCQTFQADAASLGRNGRRETAQAHLPSSGTAVGCTRWAFWHRRRASHEPCSSSAWSAPTDNGGDLLLHGVVLVVDVIGAVPDAGDEGHKAGAGPGRWLLRDLPGRAGRDPESCWEVRPGFPHRLLRQHGDVPERHLHGVLRSHRRLERLHQ